MRPGLRQAALTLLFMGAIGLIGSGHRYRLAPDQAPPPSTGTTDTRPPIMKPAASTTTSAPTLPRSIEIRVYPSDAAAEIAVTDASGSAITSEGGFEGNLLGEVALEVEAEGYRRESHVIAPEQEGTYEVFLDPPDQVVDRTMAFATGAGPKQVAFTPDGEELWVTVLAGAGVEVYDPETGEELATIDLPEAGSVEVIFDSSGETAWVSQMETATVYEVDVEGHRVRRELDTGGSWTKVMTLSPDETRLWASNWVSNDVSEFDPATGEMVRRLPTVTTPRGLVTDEAGSRLFVAGYDAGEIQMLDLDAGEGEVIHATGGAMRHLVRSPDLVYASDMARDAVFTVHPATLEVSEFAVTDRLPNTIDVSPGGELLAVSNRGRNHPETYHLPGPEWGSVLLYDTSDGELLDAIVGGNQPTGLDVSPDGEWLAYSDFLDDRVTVLSLPPIDRMRAAGGGRSDTYRSELRK